MDEDSLRNWGYYEPSFKGHLGLQLMSSMVDRHTKPFLSGHDNPLMVPPNGTYHPRDRVAAELPSTHMDYVRDSWINHREKFLHMFPTNTFNPVLAETSGAHHAMPATHQPDPTKDTESNIEEPSAKKGHVPAKKRPAPAAPKTTKSKKPRKGPVPKENGRSSVHRAKTSKKNMDVVINGVDFDISGIPIPVCSCTGTSQQCYRWGFGGWQSACCTMTISMYPLPMSTKRRGARIAGRKMSQGAFKKVLEKLASEGYDFTNSIDLRTYWAKHGTNKFVTIR
ncbi:GAGA-binding transcriptional activator [Dorcoceras hygrometricum]|uniref:GAGA-binding transcriptional activator n=1 Tax=Dorcoceras hygrometricum TaxID=472368 RepID=A0A2Z7CHN4_9LAMI|nr:GAGA-binding transcriptional activator [Dorcoceras hygrometricum]